MHRDCHDEGKHRLVARLLGHRYKHRPSGQHITGDPGPDREAEENRRPAGDPLQQVAATIQQEAQSKG